MRAAKAWRLRFAILTARRRFSPDRLTAAQNALLDSIGWDGLMVGDRGTMKAYEREYGRARERWLNWTQ